MSKLTSITKAPKFSRPGMWLQVFDHSIGRQRSASGLRGIFQLGIFFLTYCSNTELCKAFLFVSSYSFTEDLILCPSSSWHLACVGVTYPLQVASGLTMIASTGLSVYDTIFQYTTGSQFVKWVDFIAYFLIQAPFSNVINDKPIQEELNFAEILAISPFLVLTLPTC